MSKNLRKMVLPALALQAFAFLLPVSVTLAASDATTVVRDAVENTVAAGNYTWSSTLVRPDGQIMKAEGQIAGDKSLITLTDENGAHRFAQSGASRFMEDDKGVWTLLPPPPHPHQNGEPEAAGEPAHAQRGPRGALGFETRGGRPGFRPLLAPPDRHLTGLVEHVDNWTINGDTFVGQFSGMLPPPGRDMPPGEHMRPAAKDHSGSISIKVEGGVVSTVSIQGAGRRVDANGATQSLQHSATTTFSLVGTTTVTLPAEVNALLSSG